MPQSPDAAGFRPIPAWHSVTDAERVGETIGVLARRELIADERRGCRRSFARGWGGMPVSAIHHLRRLLCPGRGHAGGPRLGVPGEGACTALKRQTGRPIQDWNDDPARRRAEVIAEFNAAICRRRKKRRLTHTRAGGLPRDGAVDPSGSRHHAAEQSMIPRGRVSGRRHA